MPLSTTVAKKVYVTDESTVEFPFAYRFFETSDLVVSLYTIADGTIEVLTEETDYTVTGGDDGDGGTTDYSNGGTVTLSEAAGDGYKLIIERTLPLTQTFNFAPGGNFSEDDFEEELDRIVAILQQQQSLIDRCLKMDKSFSSVTDAFTTDDVDLSVDSFVIDELTAKTTIGSSDYIPIADGDDANVNKKILASSIISINDLTEDASLHANDVFLFEDSQASYVKKKVTRNNLVNISSLTEKTALANADLIMIEDSAASNAKKKVQASNIQPINTLTEKTTLADDDVFMIEDSASSYAKKKVKKSNFLTSRVEIFTSNGTFTAPVGVTQVLVTALGGGGGGGGSVAGNWGGGGGAAGEAFIKVPYTVTPLSKYAVVVGAGGAGGASNNNGTIGGNSTFNTTGVVARGGNYGLKGTATSGLGGAAWGLDAPGLTGTETVAGGGIGGSGANASASEGGGGGGSIAGKGGAGSESGAGDGATGYGAGGGGANSGNYAGGAGTAGFVIIEW